MRHGLVSVIIPTFQRPHFLKLAVESVARQSHEQIELIVVDDASQYGTETIVSEAFIGRAAPIVLQSYRQGPAAARNAGLAVARGKYIQFLDDDDELFPEKISDQVRILESQTHDVVYGDWLQGADLPSSRLERRTTHNNHFASLVGITWVSLFAYLASADWCRRIGGWDETVRYNDDLDFFLRMAAAGARFSHVPAVTGFYRWHQGPKVSRSSRIERSRTTSFIIRRATSTLAAQRALDSHEKTALVSRWQRLALEAVGEPALFRDAYANLDTARANSSIPAPVIERVLSPRTAFLLYHLARPLHWGRRAAHAVLPLAVRRFAARIRQRFSRLKRKGADPVHSVYTIL